VTATWSCSPLIALASWPDGPGHPVMVLMRRPIGRMLLDGLTRKPVLAWQAERMSTPPGGTHKRSGIVPDRPLSILATLTEAQAEAISKRLALRDFNAALDDLVRIVEAGDLAAGAQLDRAVEQAALLAVSQHMLERAPSGLALAEIGFRPKTPDATDWYCSISHGALRAWVGARLQRDGCWQLRAALGEGDARVIHDGELPAESCRGLVAARLIELLGLPPGEDSVPESLVHGVGYTRLQRDLARMGAADHLSAGAPAAGNSADVGLDPFRG
jgi:hypothetical protein